MCAVCGNSHEAGDFEDAYAVFEELGATVAPNADAEFDSADARAAWIAGLPLAVRQAIDVDTAFAAFQRGLRRAMSAAQRLPS